MTTGYETPSWSLSLPSDWTGEADEICHAFCTVDGVGVLQISSARKHDGTIDEADLREFACDDLPESHSTTTVICGGFRRIGAQYVEGDTYWRKLWVCSGNLLLFVTYNCAAEDRGHEDDVVNAILNTLTARS